MDIFHKSTLQVASVVYLIVLVAVPASAQGVVGVPGDTSNLQTAISMVSDGGLILIDPGTYPAPSGGFRINNLGKSFSIRSNGGGEVRIDGSGTHDALRFQNSSLAAGRQVTFEGLTFRSGFSTTEGIAAGVTIYNAQATFRNCNFEDNQTATSTTVGGAVYVAENSEVLFLDCTWSNNTSKVGGAGLGIRSNSTVFVHRGLFENNLANPPNHNPHSGGGGINAGNSTLRVSNTSFIGNEATYGGGLYAIGNWSEPYSNPTCDVIVANSRFVDNTAVRDPSVVGSLPPTEGGGINVEDQTLIQIYNSRFETNEAMIGGGVNLYRSICEIRESIFWGNRAVDTQPQSGFGGAVKATSDDGPADGSNNRPTTALTIEDSFIQCRFGAVGTAAQTGAGVFAAGDGVRIDGNPDVPDIGSVADNRALLIIRRSIIADCDAYAPQQPYSGLGGGIATAVADVTIEDSLIIGSDALGIGDWASGGGIAAYLNSDVTITGTTIADNTANRVGGGLFTQGSALTLTASQLFENEISPGVSEGEYESYGSALFTSIDEGRGNNASGTVSNSVFSGNTGMTIFDDDRDNSPTVPINSVRYEGNSLHSNQFSGRVYRDSLTAAQSAAGLNGLTVARANGLPSTDKSQLNTNTSPGSAPSLGELLSCPPLYLLSNAPGEPSPPTEAYVGYAWSGSSADLDGSAAPGSSGVITATGSHELDVDGEVFNTSVSAAPLPLVSVSSDPSATNSGDDSDVQWEVPSGTFLDGFIDHGIGRLATPDGSFAVSPLVTTTWTAVVICDEGGSTDTATVTVYPGSGLIFAHGFESGNTSGWTSATN